MYQVLIADDEQIVVDGIRFMLEENYQDLKVVATANSGREAIESGMSCQPDIVFMDIKMPGITGIEAISALRKRHPDTKFIIVSAYEQFEYAKQAVELSVSHYILKPVTNDKIKTVMTKVLSEIDGERLARQQELANREKLERIIPVLEHGFIYALLMNGDYREELIKYQELFDIDRDTAYVMMLEFGEDGQKTLSNRIGSGLKGQNLYPKVQSLIKYKCRAIVGPLMVNRITLVVHPKDQLEEYEQRVGAMTLADSLKSSIEELLDARLHIGIGGIYPFQKIKHSMEEAVYALNRIGDEQILHINDISRHAPTGEGTSYLDLKEDELKLVNLVEVGREDAILGALESFFLRIEKKFGHQFESMANMITELMVMILSSCYEHNILEQDAGYATYLEEIRQHKQIVPLQQWTVSKVLQISGRIQDTRTNHTSSVVREAKTYLDDHYNVEIGLTEISKMVAVSPQYFSKIFKEEIGLSFVEYVRMKRMEVAKDMLRSGQHSVKEICYQIGYNDPNYFSRLFKKLVGVSPTDFN